MSYENARSPTHSNSRLPVAEQVSSNAAGLPAVPVFRHISPAPGVVQRIKGLVEKQKVKVNKGTEENPIVTGTILEVLNGGEYYKVILDQGGLLETYLEKVVYPDTMDDEVIHAINREQVKRATMNEDRFDGGLLPIREFPATKKERSQVKTSKGKTETEGSGVSEEFNAKIEAYINSLKTVAKKSSEGFSFDGKIISMSDSLGAKQREAKAKELGLRYDKATKKVSFKGTGGKVEEVSVEERESELESHQGKVKRLKGEYEKALGMGLERELKDLLRNEAVIAAYKKTGGIDPGQLGELRATRMLENKYSGTHGEDYLIIGSVHFWGERSGSGKLNDISNELDHLVIRPDKEKYQVIGIYNTKAGPNLQSAAEKQNIKAKTMLEFGATGEYQWEDEEGTKYTLKSIKGTVDKGPGNLLGRPFELELGKYTVDENAELGTIGPTRFYDLELPHTGVLANALTYCLLEKDPRFGKYFSGGEKEDGSGSTEGGGSRPKREKDLQRVQRVQALEEKMRGKALFEAEQLGTREDEFAEWDELLPYLNEEDKLLLREAWNAEQDF